jgi:hypothetical protein
MIRYSLRCRKDHEFEAWFRSISDYETQVKKRNVSCPICGDAKVEKALMAPSIGRAGKDKGASPPAPTPTATEAPASIDTPAPAEAPQEKVQLAADPRQQALIQAMRELRKKITDGADYVGDKFAEEARKIHYKETEPRGIYGEATREEAEKLAEEGVEFAPLPPVPDDRN